MKTLSYGFFDYKDYIDYHGEDYFSLTHIICMVLLTLLLITLIEILRKTNKRNVKIYLKVVSILMPCMEIFKISWETYYDIKLGHGFNYGGLLPLYTCSMFMYVLPFAAFSKNEKVQNIAYSFLTTISVFGGLTNFYLLQLLHTYPFWTYAIFASIFFHFMMTFTGLFILATKTYTLKFMDIIYGWIPVLIFSFIVIPINFYLQRKGFYPDYMLLMHGNGAPLLPKLSTFFINHDLHLVYSIIVVIGYMMISVLVVFIFKFIKILLKKEKLVVN